MPNVENTDVLLINRGGVDYKVSAGELVSSGPPGDKGDDGDAATVTVGDTYTGAAGTDAKVINRGTTSAAILEFTIPKGDKGDKGEDATSILDVKGTVCLNDATVPVDPNDGDAYINSCNGTSNAAWAPGIPTGTVHNENDIVVYNDDSSQWILLSLGLVSVDLGIDNRGTDTLDITCSSGDDVTVPAATNLLAGLMTAADKATLDSGGTPNGGTGDRPSSPEIGDLYFDTDLDLLLVWNGTEWEPVSPPAEAGVWTRTGTTLAPTTDGDTVEVTAADGTANITLNSNGSAQFNATDDAVTIVGSNTAGEDTRLRFTMNGNVGAVGSTGTGLSNGKGNVWFATRSGSGILNKALYCDSSQNVLIGGTLPSAPNITLNADGSAEFLGGLTKIQTSGSIKNITHGLSFDGTTVTGGQGVFLSGAGGNSLPSSFRRNTTGSGPVVLVGSAGDPSAISLNADGSGEFTGKVTSASTEGTDGGTTLVTKDYLETGGDSSAGPFGYWKRNGGVGLTPVNASDSVLIGGTFPSAPNIKLKTDGEGEFAFKVRLGTPNTTLPTGRGIVLNRSGYTFNQKPDGGGSESVWASWVGTSQTCQVLADGTYYIGGALPNAPNITLKPNGEIITTADATINGVTVGRGSGDNSTNTAFGIRALDSNTTGTTNTALGAAALDLNTEGSNNVAAGANALGANTTGDFNVAVGRQSLRNNVVSDYNTAIGMNAGYYIQGSNNTILGAYKGVSADASLSDTIILSAGPNEKLRIDSTGSLLFGGVIPSAPNITLNSDGTGVFNGIVRSANPTDADPGNTLVTKNYLNGTGVDGPRGFWARDIGVGIAKIRPVNNGDNVVIRDTAGTTETIKLNADGSADFSGRVDVGDPAGAGGTRIKVGDHPQVYVKSTSTTQPALMIEDGTNLSKINSDGSSQFAGDMEIGGTLPNAPNITLNADGSAEFAGKVTSASTETTDSGTTLVTKDYLETGGDSGTGAFGYWNRTGTDLTPVNPNDSLQLQGDVEINKAIARLNLFSAGVNSLVGLKNSSSTNGGQVLLSDLDLILKNRDNGSVQIWTNDTNRLVVSNQGDVTIGGTLPNAPNISLKDNGEIITKADATINGITVGRGGGDSKTNAAVGHNALLRNTTGISNTATGYYALLNNTTGSDNVAIGRGSLSGNIEGSYNSATGYNALYVNTTGNNNTATGYKSLNNNINGSENTATGNRALFFNETGNNNTAIGSISLENNTTGTTNTAAGRASLGNNTDGRSNSAFGHGASFFNTTGNFNASVGLNALYENVTGEYNTAIGSQSGFYIEGSNNTILGAYKGTTADATLSDTVIISAGTTERLRIDSAGSLLFGGTLPSAPNIKLNANGSAVYGTSATTRAQINVGMGPFLGQNGTTAVYRVDKNGNVDIGGTIGGNESSSAGNNPNIKLNNDGSAHFKGNVTSDGTIGFNLEADDDTKYTTTTDSEGNETRVYNGATLDVKDRLQKADAALQALKTAAASATDFTSLQSAIVTALADI